jgi:hypothetical protein
VIAEGSEPTHHKEVIMLSTSPWARSACLGAALLALLTVAAPRLAVADTAPAGVVTDTWKDVMRGVVCGMSIGLSIVTGGYFTPGAVAICLIGIIETQDG